MVTGDSKSDYWDNIMLVRYKTRAAFCKMVNSEEYAAVVDHKVRGAADGHTYLTRQIFGYWNWSFYLIFCSVVKLWGLQDKSEDSCKSIIWAVKQNALCTGKMKGTLNILKLGHSDFFDINVPGFFLKFWYQCPNSCPTFLTQILPIHGMKLWITITSIVICFYFTGVYGKTILI